MRGRRLSYRGSLRPLRLKCRPVATAYPCHFKHHVGDEVTFDGESCHGRLCPSVWPLVVLKVTALHQAGPRYVEWASYYPFWYCALSGEAPEQEKLDGAGFRNVLHTVEPPPYHMARLSPPGAFTWPPSDRGGIASGPAVTCPDLRTAAVFRLEAFDLSEKGFDTSYFRRQMAILEKLRAAAGAVPRADILGLFSRQEIEDIYPALGAVAAGMLTEELELLGYVQTAEGLTTITPKGEAKLEAFKVSLPPEHRDAWPY